MREILFRGQLVYAKKWIVGSLLQNPSESSCEIQEYSCAAKKFSVIPDTVCEFTGFYDKNNIGIFEGDIVEFLDCETDNYGCATGNDFINRKVVIFEDGAFRIYGSMYETLYDIVSRNTNCKVVGNIYDNPELLSVVS